MLTETVDCPLCAGRDVVAVEGGQFFCTWCLYEWQADTSLVLDATVDEAAFLTGVALDVDGGAHLGFLPGT